jgi:NAD(P)-dependent dehydrogenase (short-subunit alcohol dehydrogenase family)
MRLNNRVAVVTGAASGIVAKVVRCFGNLSSVSTLQI